MSTAHEILARRTEADQALGRDLAVIKQWTDRALWRIYTDVALCGEEASYFGLRYVGAKRARKLRRRGEHVFYAESTSTGKARYGWIRLLRISL